MPVVNPSWVWHKHPQLNSGHSWHWERGAQVRTTAGLRQALSLPSSPGPAAPPPPGPQFSGKGPLRDVFVGVYSADIPRAPANNCTHCLRICRTLVAQTVKNLPAMQESQVQPLGQEDPLEKEIGTHSSVLTRESWWATVGGVTKSQKRLSD